MNQVSEGESWFQSGGSALSLATTGNSVELVQMLLDAGADPDLDGEFLRSSSMLSDFVLDMNDRSFNRFDVKCFLQFHHLPFMFQVENN